MLTTDSEQQARGLLSHAELVDADSGVCVEAAGDAQASRHHQKRAARLAPAFSGFAYWCGYLAVLILCLFIDGTAVEHLYRHAQLLWLVCPLLAYWITRFWLLARRGHVRRDLLAFVFKDRATLAVVAATAATVLLAAY